MMNGTQYSAFKTLRGDNPVIFLNDDYAPSKGATRDGVSRGLMFPFLVVVIKLLCWFWKI
jgi:hypothetical protein